MIMAKKLLNILLVFICTATYTFAQNYNNNWINYSQQYYFFSIAQDGVYRIDSTTLANAGINLNSIDPRNFSIYARGEEIPIYVRGEADGVFNSGDFIEFFAKKNDGFLDEQLYVNPSKHPNPYYSLFTDSIRYYLTWNNSFNNKRLVTETDQNFSAFSQQLYYNKEVFFFGDNTYYYGAPLTAPDTDPEYVDTEGWFDAAININQNRVRNLATSAVFTSGPAAKFKTTYVGASNFAGVSPDHDIRVHYQNNQGVYTLLHDTLFNGYEQISFERNIPANTLGSSGTNFRYTSASVTGVSQNRTAIAFLSLIYPRQFSLGNIAFEEMKIPSSSQQKIHIGINGLSTNLTHRIIDLTNNRRYEMVNVNGVFRALLPNVAGEKNYVYFNNTAVNNISQLQPIKPNNPFFTNFNNLEGDYLIVSHTSLMQGANSYGNYRNSVGFNSVTVDVEELYHQFSYGVSKHPLSIRNFVQFALDNWNQKPEYLFLIGKSINAVAHRKNVGRYRDNLVPSFGVPTCDALFTARMNGTLFEMAVPTGRLAAKNLQEVNLYRDKMVEYETVSVPPQEWQKNILHFSGGSNIAEQQRLSNYLSSYESIITDTLYGGSVVTIKKSTTAPVQITLADSIRTLINNGVSMMTFFGHASGSSFDISIEAPSTYNNQGKYPFLLANSCLSGDIHQPGAGSTSEEFVLIENKGVIGFLATVGFGFESGLNLYSNNLYRQISHINYGGSIGNAMRESVKAIQGAGTSPIRKSTSLQFTLHGDPALAINSHPKPDIMISEPNVIFSPRDVNTQLDSFDVSIVLTNLGKAFADDFTLKVRRQFSDDTNDTLYHVQNGLLFKDTVTFRLPVNQLKGAGLNQFHIEADYFQSIDEITKANNILTVPLNITSSEITPVYPYQYAVVPNQGITLKASTGDPFAPIRNYVFELDTTDLFNSPFKTTTTISHAGGVVEWQPSVLNNMPDSMVYYWRVSPEADNLGNFRWRESSFQYIVGKEGWGQDHFFQYKNNNFTFIDYNRQDRTFDFLPSAKQLFVNNVGSPSGQAEIFTIEYKLDALIQDYGACVTLPSIHVAVIDPLTLEPWESRFTNPQGVVLNPNNNFGNANDNGACRQRPEKYFIYRSNSSTQMNNMLNLIENVVPDGHYILVYSVFNGNYQNWNNFNPAIHQAFQNLGATQLSSTANNIPIIFFAQKGNSNFVHEIIGDSANAVIQLDIPLFNNITFGNMTSTIVGPAADWGSFHWKSKSIPANPTDTITIEMYGRRFNGSEALLSIFDNTQTDVLNLNNLVDANEFPYLKLRAVKRDDSLQVAPQLQNWHVLYDKVPELALDPSTFYSYNGDSVSQGSEINLKFAVKNISDKAMNDSVYVDYSVRKNNGQFINIERKKIKPLQPDSTAIAEFTLNSLDYTSANNIWIEVNPRDNSWQTEQYHFNNIAEKSFFVTGDRINPILDVTFDGVHILNNDIVSSRPYVVITLKDENQFLALEDTTSFAVFIKKPDENLQPIYFKNGVGEENMRFTPATLPDNQCRIDFEPIFEKDGTYELRVQAKDMSNNLSGKNDYIINFEVINRSTITEVLNYPNPFSTSTRFVFTLTGSEVPTNFKIQIMTISGKVVREIFQDELGPIRIGRNITEFAWDGTDQFGDRLANGVYLYRVVTQINGSTIDKRETEADKFFHKGFGKMYLMR